MKNVRIAPLDPQDEDLCQSAWQCYQAGFAGEPWNEEWPISQISDDIRTCLSLPDSCCLVAVCEGRVVGLTLGYVLPFQELGRHLGLDLSESAEAVAYQDEIVVHPEWQGRGIGRLLYDAWIAWVDRQAVSTIAARTLSDPPTVVFPWYARLGYRIAARYPSPDKRVILILAR